MPASNTTTMTTTMNTTATTPTRAPTDIPTTVTVLRPCWPAAGKVKQVYQEALHQELTFRGPNPHFTEVATVFRGTCAGKIGGVSRHTGSIMPAGHPNCAWVVFIILTAHANETRWAGTGVAVACVGTRSTILTWSRGT